MTCENCGKDKSYLCKGCYKVSYCGKECQRKKWETHKLVCTLKDSKNKLSGIVIGKPCKSKSQMIKEIMNQHLLKDIESKKNIDTNEINKQNLTNKEIAELFNKLSCKTKNPISYSMQNPDIIDILEEKKTYVNNDGTSFLSIDLAGKSINEKQAKILSDLINQHQSDLIIDEQLMDDMTESTNPFNDEEVKKLFTSGRHSKTIELITKQMTNE